MNHLIKLPRSVRPARIVGHGAPVPAPASVAKPGHVLMVDLNNFASFPTLAIGLMVATLRSHGFGVRLICPLAHDVPAVQRERQETIADHWLRRIHLSDQPSFLGTRDLLRALRTHVRDRPHATVLREVRRALADHPDVILLSAYLQHYNTVVEIARMAAAQGVKVLLGGPMFNLPEVADAWRGIPGVTAVVGAEVDMVLPEMIDALLTTGDLGGFAGVSQPNGRRTAPARPLRNLDAVAIPDFTDFPWDRYPVRIVPIMTGRGCQWDRCLFCSDVVSVSGRTFRTRSVDSVLLELQEQARRHETTSFLFLDLKLNSNPAMIRGIAQGLQRYVPGAEWIGTVHVDLRRDNGLSRADLFAAVAGGMRRISFGLESGSQRLLDLMQKGTSVERNAAFIRDAYDAGLSIRCTMFKGYPGETAADMEATAAFLETHGPYLDRVRFNDFSLQHGTPIFEAVMEKAGLNGAGMDGDKMNRAAGPGPLLVQRVEDRKAHALYRSLAGTDPAYRRAKARALAAVYAINRRPLRNAARQFDGLM